MPKETKDEGRGPGLSDERIDQITSALMTAAAHARAVALADAVVLMLRAASNGYNQALAALALAAKMVAQSADTKPIERRTAAGGFVALLAAGSIFRETGNQPPGPDHTARCRARALEILEAAREHIDMTLPAQEGAAR